MKIIEALCTFLVALIKGVLSEGSRDKSSQVSGELDAENKILEAAAERSEDAKKIDAGIRNDTDDELSERMRRNRAFIHATRPSGRNEIKKDDTAI